MNALLNLHLALVLATTTPPADVIRLRGGDTLGAKMVPQLAEAFKASGHQVKFDIAAESSPTAFPALLNGTADIGMSMREIMPDEEKQFTARGIALEKWHGMSDMIGIVVNAKNPLTGLTAKQVETIFTGDVTNWDQVGGASGTIAVHTRNTASSVYKDFTRLAMSGRPYGGTAQKMVGGEMLVTEVAKNEHGITYVSGAYLKAKGIKVLKINGLDPTVANLATYPYVRKGWCYTRPDLSAPARAFLGFMFSPQGSEVILKTGFIPSQQPLQPSTPSK